MIYWDITDILEYARGEGTLTGVQRTSVTLINRIVSAHGGDGVRLIGYHPIEQRVLVWPAEFFAGRYTFDQERFCVAFGLTPWRARLKRYVQARRARGWPTKLEMARLRLLNRLSKGGVLRALGIDGRLPAAPMPAERLGTGDVIFTCGTSWDADAFQSYLQAASERGARVVQHMFDLIPLVRPEFVGEDTPALFARWLMRVSRIAARFVTISLATQNDLRAFFRQADLPEIPSTVVPLAHEFLAEDNVIPVAPSAPWRLPASLRVTHAASIPYALCVGTIEGRKNVWRLLTVWKALVEALGPSAPRLVLAGKLGAHREDIEDFLRGTGNLYGYVRIVERPRDSDLAALYAHCLFSIYPSLYEGWGLPIGEALWFGRPVIASHMSSMPEVGGDLVDYIDPLDPAGMLAAVRRMTEDGAYREARAAAIDRARLRRWQDVAEGVWAVLQDEAAAARPGAEPMSLSA